MRLNPHKDSSQSLNQANQGSDRIKAILKSCNRVQTILPDLKIAMALTRAKFQVNP
jgi:hypothetical protein